MKEEFVTFEIAKKLKEKGYNGKTTGKHVEKISGTEREEWDDAEMMYVTVTDVVTYPNAHIYDVLKWLRKEKKLHIAVDIWSREWGYDVLRLMGGDSLHWSGIANYKNYEEAALAGIEYVLDNLI